MLPLRTKSGQPIETAGIEELLLAPDGSTTWGRIDTATAQKAGMVAGDIQVSKKTIEHTINRHGAQILNMKYPDVQTFILDVLQSYERIYQGTNDTYLLAKAIKDHYAVAAIELTCPAPGLYITNTGLIERIRGLKNKQLLFEQGANP